jgi:NADH-quinone oxidoreductase subunit J
MIVLCVNPVYSIISFSCVVIGLSFILLWCNVEFLSLILLLIYLGAIAILFLFIILALQLKEVHVKTAFYNTPLSQIFFFFLLVKSLLYMYCYNVILDLTIHSFSLEYCCDIISINAIPRVLLIAGGDACIFLHLFTDKSSFFILIGFMLLFSMLGSISLCVHNRIQP